MRGGGRGRSGARDVPEEQVMSPPIPQSSHQAVSVPVVSVPVSFSGLPVSVPASNFHFHSPGSGSVPSPAPASVSASSHLSEASASILNHFQRHTLKAPVLRHFLLTDFRIWHHQFRQFIKRAGPEFAMALTYPPSSAHPPPSPAILAAVETLLLDALQPALVSTQNFNAVSVLQSFLTTHAVDPASSPGKLFMVLATHFRLGQAANLLTLEAEVFATRPLTQESVEAYLHRLHSHVVAHDVAARALAQPPISDIRLFRFVVDLLPSSLRDTVENFMSTLEPQPDYLPFVTLFERLQNRLRLATSMGHSPLLFRSVPSPMIAAYMRSSVLTTNSKL